ncbi:DM13 domain-containing protein (plasmid) [Bacillus sp. CMF21]|nr:DM13 domain-containing protein [Bacillus sp. CMF21]
MDQPTNEGFNLGELKGNEGDQNYLLLSAVDLQDGSWKGVIWCRAFNVDFGSAILQLQ